VTSAVEWLNDARPWWGWLDPRSALSAVQLVQQGTLSAEAMAVVWWAIEHGASVFVAAGPRGAGKTTLANALLEFLPAEARLYVTSGPRDQLDVGVDRQCTYLLVNELSWHLPFYLSGPAAARAFGLLTDGVRMVGTLHATSVEEALEVIGYEAGVPRSVLTAAARRHPMLVLILDARRAAAGIVRRVVEIALVHAPGDRNDLQIQRLNSDHSTFEALALWVGSSPDEVRHDVGAHVDQLLKRIGARLSSAD
jgi:type IV secretory pathway ATPase VirB11/archaellum biosynthesis ATPase